MLCTEREYERNHFYILHTDSTSEYIKGIEDEEPKSGVYWHGLQCAVILIGAFHRKTGSPVLGVVNQPFSKQDPESKR